MVNVPDIKKVEKWESDKRINLYFTQTTSVIYHLSKFFLVKRLQTENWLLKLGNVNFINEYSFLNEDGNNIYKKYIKYRKNKDTRRNNGRIPN